MHHSGSSSVLIDQVGDPSVVSILWPIGDFIRLKLVVWVDENSKKFYRLIVLVKKNMDSKT